MTNTLPSTSHILLVDDDIPLRNVLATALTKAGYTVAVAADGRSAEAYLSKLQVDLMITDIMMPEEDGMEMLMNLRAEKSTTPIIAMTGVHSFTGLYLKAAALFGASRVLCKPFEMEELLGKVREMIGESSDLPVGVPSQMAVGPLDEKHVRR